jgi:hypothetical protein
MPYEFYKVMHIFGLILTVASIGGVAQQVFTHGHKQFPGKKGLMFLHGFGAFLVFLSGFGLMARIGLVSHEWPTWIITKMTIWLLVLALAPTWIMRLPRPKLWAWWAIPALLLIAVIAAVYKQRFI